MAESAYSDARAVEPGRRPPDRDPREEVARGDRADPGVPAVRPPVPVAVDRARRGHAGEAVRAGGREQRVSPHGPRATAPPACGRSSTRPAPRTTRRRSGRRRAGPTASRSCSRRPGRPGCRRSCRCCEGRRRLHRLGRRAVRDQARHGGRQLRAAQLRPLPARHLDDAEARRLRGDGRPGPRHAGRLSRRPRQRQRRQRAAGRADALPPADRREPRGRAHVPRASAT